MPTSPFAHEHAALRDSVRRLVAQRLGSLAPAAESGEDVHAEALRLSAPFRALGDVLADVVVAEELGRLRSAGLVAVLLDAALVHDAGLGEAPVAVVRRHRARLGERVADGELPAVIGGRRAQRFLLLSEEAVVELTAACEVDAAARSHSLRGAALADVSLQAAPWSAAPVTGEVRALAELREAASLVGGAWQTFDDALSYAGQRTAFGRPIGKFQVNRHALAELATWLTAAEALVHDTAAALADGATPDRAAGAAARMTAGRTARRVADVAVQLHGGYGYTMAFDVQRAWRDARASAVGDDDRRSVISGARGGPA